METKHELSEVAMLERFILKYKFALYIAFINLLPKVLVVKQCLTYQKIESDGFVTKPGNKTLSTVIKVSCMLFNLVIFQMFQMSIKVHL